MRQRPQLDPAGRERLDGVLAGPARRAADSSATEPALRPEAGGSSPPSPSRSAANGRLIYLDVLRAVAVLLVLGNHRPLDPPAGAWGSSFVNYWRDAGWTGVTLFFVLSGFLIGGLLFHEHRATGSIRTLRFYMRRIFKIWPPYVAWLAAAMALIFIRGSGSIAERGGLALHDLWPNFVHLQNYIFTSLVARTSINGHTWSLAVEEHFYLTLPILLILVARLSRRVGDGTLRLLPGILVALIVVCTATRVYLAVFSDISASSDTAWYAWVSTHLRMDALAMGVLLAYVVSFAPALVEPLRRWRLGLLSLGTLCFLPAVLFPLGEDSLDYVINYSLGLSLQALGSLAVVLWAWFASHGDGAMLVDRSPRRRGTDALVRWLASIGVWSYSIYVWHFPFAMIAGWHIGNLLGATDSAWRYGAF